MAQVAGGVTHRVSNVHQDDMLYLSQFESQERPFAEFVEHHFPFQIAFNDRYCKFLFLAH
ncbi:MAG: hypothetical protein R3E08_01950 [Thiotrichaceae bacterium]